MIDYKKAQKADKLLLESGVPFMLVYDNTDKHMICRAFGNYPTLKEIIVTMMVQAVVNVQSKYGEEAAMKELMGMMTEAAQQYCEETKKEAEKMLAERGIDMKKLKLAALMENQETIKRSVSKGMGVTILSKLAAEEELKNGTLLAFPLGSQGGKRMINLVYDAEYPLLPAAERFIKMIKRMYLKKENTGIGECK